MKKFKTLDGLYKHINNCLKNAMEIASKKTMEELKGYVAKEWYAENGTPQSYNRTWEFYESIVFYVEVLSDKKIESGIQSDTNLIKAKKDDSSYWNQHMSLDEIDVADAIPKWIDYGNNPNGSHKIAYEFKGIYMTDYIKEWAEQNYKKILKEELKKQGLKFR